MSQGTVQLQLQKQTWLRTANLFPLHKPNATVHSLNFKNCMCPCCYYDHTAIIIYTSKNL